jgi:hypothetical protein
MRISNTMANDNDDDDDNGDSDRKAWITPTHRAWSSFLATFHLV